MSFQLSATQRATLRSLVVTVSPGTASEPANPAGTIAFRFDPEAVVAGVEKLLKLGSESLQSRATRLLNRLEDPLWGWAGMRANGGFSRLSTPDRERLLNSLLPSGSVGDRLLLAGILKLIHYHAYAAPPVAPKNEEELSSLLDHLPEAGCLEPVRLPTASRVRSDQEVFAADYLVIGSGAAGSVMAAELAETGRSVILAEAGPLPRAAELGKSERVANRLWLESRGTLPTPELPLQLLAGRAVGGGTVLNWGTCLGTPAELLEYWRESAGFAAACGDAWRHSEYAVRRRMELAPAGKFNPSNELLQSAAEQLGWSWRVVERNQGSCPECHTCSFGCAGGRRDALRTYLLDAERLGVHLLPDCRVELLEGEAGKIDRARGFLRDSSGGRRAVEFRFRHLVLAAGAIHTPALLLRSGLGNNHVGQHLQLHPAAVVLAEFDREVAPWSGPAQAVVCEHFTDCGFTRGRDPKFGYRLETVPLTPGRLALSLPWHSARDHQESMARAERIVGWLVLVHDLDPRLGSVTLNGEGQPQIRYRLRRELRAALAEGITAAMRGLRAVGASRLFAPISGMKDYFEGGDTPAFDRQLKTLFRGAVRQGNLQLHSAHQMSSCRLASSAAYGAVDPTGRLFGQENLFVCDGSVLPTSTGVNPGLTIATMSHYLAQQIKRRTT